MPKHNRILVCVDGQKAGFHALSEAIRLAQWMRASVTVLTVTLFFEGDLSLVGVKNLKEAIKGPAETILRHARQMARDRHLSIGIVLEEGHTGKKIAACAAALKADLVVVGAQRRMQWTRFVIESTLGHLLSKVGPDLMVVPEDTHFSGDDFLVVLKHPTATSNPLLQAMDLLNAFGGKNILKAIPAGTQEAIAQNQEAAFYPHRQRIDQTASGGVAPLIGCGTLLYNDLSDIFRHAKEHRAGLIIMDSNSTLRRKMGLAGSRMESLIRGASCPVLILP